MSLLFIILILALLVGLNALYVAAEFATVSARRTRVVTLAEDGNGAAKRLLPYLQDPAKIDRYIAACQVGITLSSLAVGFYGQAQLSPYIRVPLPPGVIALIVLVFLTTLQVVLGELLPKSVATRYPERVALATVTPLVVSLNVLRPLIAVLNGSALWLLARLGVAGGHETHAHSPEELEYVFRESVAGGYLDADEKDMLENALRFETRLARQVMVPRNRLVTVEVNRDPQQLLAELVKTPHMRFPVFEETIDKVIGFINLKDLFLLCQKNASAGTTTDLRSIVRDAPVLPETNTVNEVWAELKAKRAPLALLFDEYGGTVGLVTLEDIIEEIVGEVQDEFDDEARRFELRDGRVFVRGDVLTERLNRRYLLRLPETDPDTVGGLFVETLGSEPEVGDELELAGLRLCAEQVVDGAVEILSFSAPGAAQAKATGEDA